MDSDNTINKLINRASKDGNIDHNEGNRKNTVDDKLKIDLNKDLKLLNKIKKLIENFDCVISLETKFKDDHISINQVYSPNRDLDSIITKSSDFITKLKSCVDKLKHEEIKFGNFQEKLNDKNIRVAMFGDVSAGKSQTINCILRRKIFIPAYCHTTICFVNIHFVNKGEYAIINVPRQDSVTPYSDLEKLREAVKELANFNGKDKLQPDDILEITLKTDKDNVIMRENVVLMDCPGANDSQEVTDIIEAVLVKADIFLYVLTQVIFEQQRQFFKRLLSKTSAPNIFVIVNKWDETDNDDEADTIKARKSLTEEISTWMNEMELNQDNHDLCQDKSTYMNQTKLNNDNHDLFQERIFFISAKETLKRTTESYELSDKQRQRYDEFKRFVKIFGKHLDDPKNIKVEKHAHELKKMEWNLDDMGYRIMEDWLPLIQMKMDCIQRIDAKIALLIKTGQQLMQDAAQSLDGQVHINYDKWYSQRLDIIRKRLEEFYDGERPGQPAENKSWFGQAKSFFGTWNSLKHDKKADSEDHPRKVENKIAKKEEPKQKKLSNQEIVEEFKKLMPKIEEFKKYSKNEQTKVAALERDATDTNLQNEEIAKENKKQQKKRSESGGDSRNEQKGRGTDNEGGLNEEEKAALEKDKLSRMSKYLKTEIDIIRTPLETERGYFLTNITEVKELLTCDHPIGQHLLSEWH